MPLHSAQLWRVQEQQLCSKSPVSRDTIAPYIANNLGLQATVTGAAHTEGLPLPAASSPVSLQVEIPGQLPAGLLFVEVQEGALLSAEQPVLVLPSQSMAREVEQLLSRCVTHNHMAAWPPGNARPKKVTENAVGAALCCWLLGQGTVLLLLLRESRPGRPPTACALRMLWLRVQDAGS